MREWLGRVFAGRRGPDAVCLVLFLAGLALSAAAMVTGSTLVGWLVYLPWVLAVLRMFSTKLEQRYQENRAFLNWWGRVKQTFGRIFGQKDGRPPVMEGTARPAQDVAADTAYHHFLCPACGQKLRVPRGRGRIEVTCPRCACHFEEQA